MTLHRYTSPELSRQLAEAFTDRDSRDFSSSGAWWRNLHLSPASLVTGTVERPRCHEKNGEADLQAVRALDLTDVLHELTRPRPEEKDASPLCEGIELHYWTAGGAKLFARDTYEKADSPVEAAGRVFLALLRERGK